MVLTGYLFGIFLLKSNPMKFSDLRKLLGLFYGTPVLWIYINQVLAGSLRPITRSFFSKSGHYIVSHTILSFCLLTIAIIFQILTSSWQSKCFPYFGEHFIASAVCNAQNEQGEYYYYVREIGGINPWNPEHPEPG
jgi:hypothetical protein